MQKKAGKKCFSGGSKHKRSGKHQMKAGLIDFFTCGIDNWA